MRRYIRRFRRSKKVSRVFDKLRFIREIIIFRKTKLYIYEIWKRSQSSYIPRYLYRFIRRYWYLIEYLDHSKSIHLEVDRITRDVKIDSCWERIHPTNPYYVIYLSLESITLTIIEIRPDSIYIDYDHLRYLDPEKLLSTIILS